MNAQYDGFIGLYKDVYPQGYCQHLINEFETQVGMGAGANRMQSEGTQRHVKNDMQLAVRLNWHNLNGFENKCPVRIFFDGLQQCYEHYASEFSVIRDGGIRGTVMKMQRTDPGGGYHIWHGEQGPGEHASRVLVYMLYLNTLEPNQAGETEFLYQQRRYSPVENTMVLWPAAFTHAHRGNTVFGDKAKYIVTGWFYYD